MRFAALTILVALSGVATAGSEPETGPDSVVIAQDADSSVDHGAATDRLDLIADGQTQQPTEIIDTGPLSDQIGQTDWIHSDSIDYRDPVTAIEQSAVVDNAIDSDRSDRNIAQDSPDEKSSSSASSSAPQDELPFVYVESGIPAAQIMSVEVDTVDSIDEDSLAKELDSFCQRVDVKLSSVDHVECLRIGLLDGGAISNQATPLLFKDFAAGDDETAARVLLIGGVHGDEYSSVSIVFKWLAMLEEDLGDRFHWRVIPVLNPDGLLRPPRMSSRMNANGVDLNRNFPTPNWEAEAHAYWINQTLKNKRRYPGPAPLSEPETAWLVEQIESFQPHAVVSVHAPHGVVDFDGPRVPPRQLGPLELRLLGTYPGSMGRYIGIHKGIPLLTLELESAFGMPEQNEVYDIWYDMLGWLHEKIALPLKLAEESKARVPATESIRVRSAADEG